MKIKISEIDTIAKLLKKIPYVPVNEKSKLFFEIDCGKVVDDGQFLMEVKEKEYGGNNLKPGLVISRVPKEKNGGFDIVIDLAYAILDYAPKFKLESYLDILDVKMNAKSRQVLVSLDAFLIKNDNIMAQFEL